MSPNEYDAPELLYRLIPPVTVEFPEEENGVVTVTFPYGKKVPYVLSEFEQVFEPNTLRKEKMLAELNQLHAHITGIKTEMMMCTDEHELAVLKEQEEAMLKYLNILHNRYRKEAGLV